MGLRQTPAAAGARPGTRGGLASRQRRWSLGLSLCRARLPQGLRLAHDGALPPGTAPPRRPARPAKASARQGPHPTSDPPPSLSLAGSESALQVLSSPRPCSIISRTDIFQRALSAKKEFYKELAAYGEDYLGEEGASQVGARWRAGRAAVLCAPPLCAARGGARSLRSRAAERLLGRVPPGPPALARRATFLASRRLRRRLGAAPVEPQPLPGARPLTLPPVPALAATPAGTAVAAGYV